MVAEAHPNDIDLFDYVEGDLAGPRRADIDAHLAGCPVCAQQVQRVQAGKAALRGSQFLHLPERRIEGVFMNLPTQPREPGRRRALSPKQLIAVLTPVIAVVAVIAVLASTGTGTGTKQQDQSASGGGVAAEASGTGTRAASQAPFSVAGTPGEVVTELQDKGFSAKRRGKTVVVTGATTEQVREALADRGPGDVQILVKPG